MKTWIRRTLIGLAGSLVLLGGIAACTHHGHFRHGWHAMSDEDAARFKARVVERAGRALDLDESQKGKLATLADTLREQHKLLVGDDGRPREAFAALIGGPRFDRERAQALVQSKTGAVQSGSPAVIAAMAEFYDSLRPEQQARLREHLARGRHDGRS